MLIIEEAKWRRARGVTALVKRAAALTLQRAGDKSRSLTILLSTDERLRRLNTVFRGQHKTTNVLSFPADAKSYLGDVSIAYGVTAIEARAAAKPFADHAAHQTTAVVRGRSAGRRAGVPAGRGPRKLARLLRHG